MYVKFNVKAERIQTLNDLCRKVRSKYKVGQVVDMIVRGVDGVNVIDKFKAKVIRFYPYHVLCEVNGIRECFTYHDFVANTRINKG